jgi:hypothetical protein
VHFVRNTPELAIHGCKGRHGIGIEVHRVALLDYLAGILVAKRRPVATLRRQSIVEHDKF